ncbi:MAG: ABC transporter substrate-binding protein, partial [Alphaproteobacteria bacterium]
MSKLNWKKVIGWAVAALIVIGVVGTNMYNQQKQANSSKKNVYAVLPLTGAFAEFGKNIQKDIEVFMRDNNYSFNIKYIDSEAKPDKAITAIQQATLYDDNPVVLSAFSTVAVALAPFIEQKKGFLFGISTITHTNTKNFLQMGPDATVYVAPVVNHLKKGNYKNVALFFIQDEYGLKQRNFLMEQLKGTPAEIKTEIAMSLSNADVRTEVYKIMSTNPDAILVQGLPSPGYLNIIRELKAQG